MAGRSTSKGLRTSTRTASGTVRGLEEAGIVVFRGIPFAQPPIGALRFRAPERAVEWSGELDATRFGPIAPQPASPLAGDTSADGSAQSEDCLTVNIWTASSDAGGRPVMVWIHGGGFFLGSGQAALASFARDDVVAVSMNYRLGALGFSPLAGVTNVGLLDQVAALEWVQENIAAFGGDPGNVTIFGCSAGGMSVCSLMAMPSARGLFHKAIAESGAGSTVTTLDDATQVAAKLCAELGIAQDDDRLNVVGAEVIVDAQQRVGGDGAALPFRPVVDGAVLPESPLDAARSGRAASVPLIIGSNRDELKLAAMAAGTGTAPSVAPALVDGYTANHPTMTAADVQSRIQTDSEFRMPAVQFAEAHADAQPRTWMYRFVWETPVFDGALGACHGLEVPFVMDDLNGAHVIPLGDDPPQHLANAVHGAWVAFAKSGAPDHAGISPWPTYERSTRATMEFASTCTVVNDPDGADRALWVALADDH